VDLGGAHQKLAVLLHKRGEPAEAERAFRRAVTLLEEAVALSPSEARYEEELDIHRSNLAVLLAKDRHFQEAEVLFRQNRDFWAKRLERDPSAPNSRSKLARSQYHVGLVLLDLGRPGEAEPALREAIKLRRGLVEDFPKGPYGHYVLGDALTKLAEMVVTNRGDQAEARRLLEQAMAQTKTALEQAPGTESYLRTLQGQYAALAESLIQLNEPSEAAKIAAELPSLFPKDATGYRDACWFLARSAAQAEKGSDLSEADRRELARLCAERAVDLLREAIRQGHKDIDHLADGRPFDEDTRPLLAEWIQNAKQTSTN
jgi:tetratricopeptide (TPR) repeat protein